MSHRDVYPMGKIPQFDRNRANATRNTNSRLATSSYENTHHYAKAPKVDIARVMDVGSGEKKKNKTLPVMLPKKEKHEDAMASLKEELVEEHGKLPKAHASDEPPEIPDDDIKTKNGKKQPKKDPAWNFMMNEIKKMRRHQTCRKLTLHLQENSRSLRNPPHSHSLIALHQLHQ